MPIPEEQQRELDEKGCILIPDVLSQSEIEVYRARLLELAKQEQGDGSAILHTNEMGQHVRWLVNKGEMFERLIAHPKGDKRVHSCDELHVFDFSNRHLRAVVCGHADLHDRGSRYDDRRVGTARRIRRHGFADAVRCDR